MLVSMMKPAHLRNRYDPAQHRGLDRSGLWAVLLQCQMRTAPMIVINEALKMSVQAALAEYDEAIKALAANGSDHPFHVRALPRRRRGREHFFDAHGFYLIDEVLSEDPIAIAQQTVARYPKETLRGFVEPSTPLWDERSRRNAQCGGDHALAPEIHTRAEIGLAVQRRSRWTPYSSGDSRGKSAMSGTAASGSG